MTAEDALRLASAVLEGEDDRTFTTERICEWVVSVLGADADGWPMRVEGRMVVVDVETLGYPIRWEFPVERARQFAAALLRAADQAEGRADE